MEKQIKFTNEMNTSMFKHKRHSWFFSSTWILLLLLSFFMWKCEKDIFEDETIGVCPEVISSDPADEATNVVTSKIITATFNEEMLPATINNQTFSVKLGTVPVSGIVTYADKIATFSPSEPLEGNKMYSGIITKKVQDPAGNYPLENYSWSFSTSIVPTVISTDPLNATSNVPLDKTITATFSTAMDPSTINPATFLVYQGTDQIAGTITENKGMPMAMAKQETNLIAGSVSYSGTTATFTPTSPLADNTVYNGTITSALKDVAGNAMASQYTWSFSTAQTTYIISLSSSSAEGGSTSGGGMFNKDAQTTVIAVPVTGYTFVNWTEGTNIVSTNANYTVTATSNMNLVANFTINTYTLDVAAENGTVAQVPSQTTYDYGSTVQLTATPNTGYLFTGWSGDATGASNPLTILMNSDKTITATFALIPPDSYTLNVTSTLGGTTAKNPNKTSYTDASVVQVSAAANTGYTFSGWSGDASGATNPLSVTMNSNKNIIANFTLISSATYTLTVISDNGSVEQNPDQLEYNGGDNVELTAIPNSGYEFDFWSGDANGTDNPLTVTMNSDKNITANYTLVAANTYTLTIISDNGDVEQNPDQLEYNDGDNVELTAIPNSGYEFDSWSGDATGSTNPVTVLMDQNKMITANYTLVNAPWPDPIVLGAASDFAILAGSGISNTGVTTMINGDVGSFPTATINGLLPGNVNGTLYTTADPIVGLAKDALDDAYFEAQSRSSNAISLPGQLGGLRLAPGLYVNSSTSGISGTGPNGILTLDAGGNANAVWIFKVGSTFITDANTSIVLAGGAKAGNIFWSIGTSATLGTNSVFYGVLLADQSITLTTGATLNGVVYTRVAAVSLDSNTITKP